MDIETYYKYMDYKQRFIDELSKCHFDWIEQFQLNKVVIRKPNMDKLNAMLKSLTILNCNFKEEWKSSKQEKNVFDKFYDISNNPLLLAELADFVQTNSKGDSTLQTAPNLVSPYSGKPIMDFGGSAVQFGSILAFMNPKTGYHLVHAKEQSLETLDFNMAPGGKEVTFVRSYIKPVSYDEYQVLRLCASATEEQITFLAVENVTLTGMEYQEILTSGEFNLDKIMDYQKEVCYDPHHKAAPFSKEERYYRRLEKFHRPSKL